MKKKRGRKPEKDHLIKANRRLGLMQSEYRDNSKKMTVEARTKLRNKISALQSRIKQRESDESQQQALN